jgi:deazaflavin-dependent oxidoreductase (nitroreductase family)
MDAGAVDQVALNAEVVRRFRAQEELPAGMHRDRLLLLTTTGRRSGTPRTTPMMRLAIGGTSYVVASNAGAPRDPGWLRDIEADPRVRVEESATTYDATARVLRGSARPAAWAAILGQAPFFADHERTAGREIPVVELIRHP